MTEWRNGAKVKTPEREPLTLSEALFVVVDVAKRDKVTAEDFLRLAAGAWVVHELSGRPL